MTVQPITHPRDGEALSWDDNGTWFCFECLGRDTDVWHELDGYVRCADCTAKWAQNYQHGGLAVMWTRPVVRVLENVLVYTLTAWAVWNVLRD